MNTTEKNKNYPVPYPTVHQVRQKILGDYMRVMGCRECGFVTGKNSTLIRHLEKVHGAEQLRVGGVKWALLTEVVEERKERFACKGCPFKGASKLSLVRHAGTHRKPICAGVRLSEEEIESIEVATSTVTETIPRTGQHAYNDQELAEIRKFTAYSAPSLTSRWRLAMNEAVAKISAKAPSLERGSASNRKSINHEIFDMAKEAVDISGFAYAKGKSRARAHKPKTGFSREFAAFISRQTTNSPAQLEKPSSEAGGFPVGSTEQRMVAGEGRPARKVGSGPKTGVCPTSGPKQQAEESDGLPTQQVHRDFPAGGGWGQQAGMDRKPVLRARRKLVLKLKRVSIDSGEPPLKEVGPAIKMSSKTEIFEGCAENIKIIMKAQNRMLTSLADQAMLDVQTVMGAMEDKILESNTEARKAINEALKPVIELLEGESPEDSVEWLDNPTQEDNLSNTTKPDAKGSLRYSRCTKGKLVYSDNSPEDNWSNIARPDTKGSLVRSPALFSGGGIVAEGLRVPRDIGMIDNCHQEFGASLKGKRPVSRPGRSAGKSTKKSFGKKNPL